MFNFEKIRKKIKKIRIFILDLIFPINCISCQKENSWLCKKCQLNFPRLEKQICPICEKSITPLGATCLTCKNKSQLDGIFIIAPYSNSLVKKALHNFKYRFVLNLYLPLGEIMVEELIKADFPIVDLIIAVPLHKKKLRWRGFNQSELLANYIAKKFAAGFKISLSKNNLVRIKNTNSQMHIKNTLERKTNVENAFAIENREEIFGKRILLIDDIVTTGATLSACAKVLKKCGAKSVFAVTVARQGII